MAQKVQVLVTDDLDGGEANETIAFGFEGTEYEIDLSTKNATAMRKAVGKYVDAARKISRTPATGRGTRKRGAAAAPKLDTEAIRTWARENGLEVKDRGRVPGEIVAKYEAAH